MKVIRLAWLAAAVGFIAASVQAQLPSQTLAQWYLGYERDGHLVSLPDGRSIAIYCVGSGSPTVILESGLGDSSSSWWSVQDQLGRTTKTCAYDRAGFGRSSPGPMPRDIRAEVADLEALLTAAKLPAPYILVGHSRGAMNARLFTSRHQDKVAGLVLVDGTVEWDRMPPRAEGSKPSEDPSSARLRKCADPAQANGVTPPCVVAAPADWPKLAADGYIASQGPSRYSALVSEREMVVQKDSDELIAERRSFGALPLVVLTHSTEPRCGPPGATPEENAAVWRDWNHAHELVATMSTASSHVVVEGACHYIHREKPQAVIDAIANVVKIVRGT